MKLIFIRFSRLLYFIQNIQNKYNALSWYLATTTVTISKNSGQKTVLYF